MGEVRTTAGGRDEAPAACEALLVKKELCRERRAPLVGGGGWAGEEHGRGVEGEAEGVEVRATEGRGVDAVGGGEEDSGGAGEGEGGG